MQECRNYRNNQDDADACSNQERKHAFFAFSFPAVNTAQDDRPVIRSGRLLSGILAAARSGLLRSIPAGARAGLLLIPVLAAARSGLLRSILAGAHAGPLLIPILAAARSGLLRSIPAGARAGLLLISILADTSCIFPRAMALTVLSDRIINRPEIGRRSGCPGFKHLFMLFFGFRQPGRQILLSCVRQRRLVPAGVRLIITKERRIVVSQTGAK